jgi:hypothetical protein
MYYMWLCSSDVAVLRSLFVACSNDAGQILANAQCSELNLLSLVCAVETSTSYYLIYS